VSILCIKHKDRDTLMGDLARAVAGDLAAALVTRGRASLAVPGGTTPGPFLERLSEADLDWSLITVTLTDERWVPPTSPRSNERLLRASLLKGPAAAAHFVPLYRDTLEPELTLKEIEADLRVMLPLDVCVVGMGEDRHTASLFPGADRLDDALSDDSPASVLPLRAAGAPEPRMTLTAVVLRNAGECYLLITGAAKAAALKSALAPGPVAEAPVRCILRRPNPARVYYAP
jgi:6-phosphogluconolactonase